MSVALDAYQEHLWQDVKTLQVDHEHFVDLRQKLLKDVFTSRSDRSWTLRQVLTFISLQQPPLVNWFTHERFCALHDLTEDGK